MKEVIPSEVENMGQALNNIATNLQDSYSSITANLNRIKACIETLLSYNGAPASEVLEEPHLEPITLTTYYKRYQMYWNVNANNSQAALDTLGSNKIKQLEESIELLNSKGDDLAILSYTLLSFISLLEAELNVTYQGDLKGFFDGIKDIEGWREYKVIYKESKEAKKNDEIYKKYHSKQGDKDYVDFFLDEIGNRRLPEGMGKDDGSQYNRGISKYGQWYKMKYPGSGMTNDAAYCAAAVSYVMSESGSNADINPFIYVPSGADDAINKDSNGIGKWHPASDTSYMPKRGDIFYQCSGATSHTGIVLDSKNTGNGVDVYTIEGNTASAGYAFGTVNTRIRNASYINNGNYASGYYSPDVYINNSVKDVTISDETINAKKLLNGNNN